MTSFILSILKATTQSRLPVSVIGLGCNGKSGNTCAQRFSVDSRIALFGKRDTRELSDDVDRSHVTVFLR